MAFESDYTNNFSSGICECCAGDDGCKTCCITFWCPFAQFGFNVERLEPSTGAWFAGDFVKSAALFFGTAVLGSLIGASASACAGHVVGGPPLFLFPMMNARRAIRRKYQIKGNSLGDFCTVFWCTPCSICQEHRQLKLPAPPTAVDGYPVHDVDLSYSAPLVVTKGDYTSVPAADPMK